MIVQGRRLSLSLWKMAMTNGDPDGTRGAGIVPGELFVEFLSVGIEVGLDQHILAEVLLPGLLHHLGIDGELLS